MTVRWTQECEDAFEALKRYLTATPALRSLGKKIYYRKIHQRDGLGQYWFSYRQWQQRASSSVCKQQMELLPNKTCHIILGPPNIRFPWNKYFRNYLKLLDPLCNICSTRIKQHNLVGLSFLTVLSHFLNTLSSFWCALSCCPDRSCSVHSISTKSIDLSKPTSRHPKHPTSSLWSSRHFITPFYIVI